MSSTTPFPSGFRKPLIVTAWLRRTSRCRSLAASLSSPYSASGITIEITPIATMCSATTRERIERKRFTRWSPGLFLGHQVADAAHGVDLHRGAVVGQHLAQTMD